MSDNEDNVVDLEEYRSRKKLKEMIERLDRVGHQIYVNRLDPEAQGMKNFIKFLKKLDKKYDKDK